MRIKFVEHKNLPGKELQEIVRIKSRAWPYSQEEQLKWIKNNIKENDVHVLLCGPEDKIIAYANLINIYVKINDHDYSALGIGNVCAYEKGKGDGKRLMQFVNEFLLQNDKIGFLFCTEKLINFYRWNQWVLIQKAKTVFAFNNELVETMVFNWNEGLRRVEYKGLAF